VATAFSSAEKADALLVLPPDDPRWLELVRSHPQALPFHLPAWSRLLTDCYGHRPFVLATPGGPGGVSAGMPVVEVAARLRRPRWVSLPFSDRCPPLAVEAPDEARLVELADHARERDGVAALEIRADVAAPGAHTGLRGVVHLLALARDPDTTFEGFSRSQVQRNVRKAERSGLVVRRADTAEDVTESFYGLHLRTRSRQGVPVQPRRFFDLLWRHVIAPGEGFALLASDAGDDVAAAVFLTAGRTVVYKFGASDPSSWHLRPNNLLFWHAIRWSCEHGFATFDFGRSELDNRGLRNFKSGWGAVEEPLAYSTLGRQSGEGGRHLAEALLGRVIRNGPLWLCRVAGEFGYRYAA
jgi:CelD/BcsL family acetyltransferase involved in cellulose biosynthesis